MKINTIIVNKTKLSPAIIWSTMYATGTCPSVEKYFCQTSHRYKITCITGIIVTIILITIISQTEARNRQLCCLLPLEQMDK